MDALTRTTKLMGRSQVQLTTDEACKLGQLSCEGGTIEGAHVKHSNRTARAKAGAHLPAGASLVVVVAPDEEGASVTVTAARSSVAPAAAPARKTRTKKTARQTRKKTARK